MLRRLLSAFAVLSLLLLVAPGLANAAAEGEASSSVIPSDDPTATIIGGRDATQTYSWMAQLGYLNMHTCGGALIAPRWVVTAKHCLGGGLQPGDDVRLGSNVSLSGGELRKIKTEIPHPSMDIGLLELDAAAAKTPIRIADNVGAMGQPTRILGWGATNPNGTGDPTYLKELDTSVVSVSKCNSDGVTNYGNEFCTDNPGGNTGACFGDSGGPQVKLVNGTWELIGATSRGPDTCGTAGSVYMSVPTFTKWIYEKTGGQAGRTTIGANTTGDPNIPGGPTATTTATATATATATSTPTSNPGGLQNGQPVAVSGAAGAWATYAVNVPAGATNLKITLAGGTGDADLYVKQGTTVSKTTYDCRSWQSGNNESCAVAAPTGGSYAIGIAAYTTYAGATLTATWQTSTTSPTSTPTSPTTTATSTPTAPVDALLNGVPRAISGASGSFTYFQIALPAGRSSLTVAMSGGTGDADLYVRSGSKPTTASYDCRPYKTGNTETCTFSAPGGGTWWVGVRAFTTYSGASLKATW